MSSRREPHPILTGSASDNLTREGRLCQAERFDVAGISNVSVNGRPLLREFVSISLQVDTTYPLKCKLLPRTRVDFVGEGVFWSARPIA